MATSTPRPSLSNTISPEVVGNMFVEQYYHFLHYSPEVVFKFYHDSSVLSRSDSNGFISSTTTMQAINEKILSMGYKDYKAEIKTADAQKSHGDGIIVLVTGSLSGKDKLKRNFTQTFFLAPQDNGYFVLNDICRYLDDVEPLATNSVNQTDDCSVQSALVSEPPQVANSPAPVPTVSSAHNFNFVEKTQVSADDNEIKGIQSSVAVELFADSKDYSTPVLGEPVSSAVSEDIPKKSYASIVSSESKISNSHEKNSSASRQKKVYIPANTKQVTPKLALEKTEKESSESFDNPSVPEAVDTNDVATENNTHHGEGEGHSVYIRNLPYEVTVAQVRAAFEIFGPILADGIQVRCHKDVGHCFGFVEFQSVSSLNNAIEASPVSVGGRRVIVEIKKTSSRAGIGKRYFQGRNAFQNGNFRGRGNFSSSGGGRAYNRNEHGHGDDLSNHSSKVPLFSGGGYHRGRGKFSQSNGQYHNQITVPA